MNNLFCHLKTVHTHRKSVRKLCFKMHLYWQGLTHDLSKYSKTEMSIAKYADGTRSPHEIIREKLGYSPSRNHHYHKNKHHWQYWIDEITVNGTTCAKMPYKYVIETFCDMTAASKTYRGKEYKETDPYDYYKYKSPDLQKHMNKKSQELLVSLFEKYIELGEKNFFTWYNKNKKELKKNYERK